MIIKLVYNKGLKKNNSDNMEGYCIETPNIAIYYKKEYKRLLKIYKNREKVINILYNKIYRKYKNTNCNFSLERIYIKTKLGSYLSGGCGIGPSLLTSLVGSGIFAYMNTMMKKLTNTLSVLYFSMVTAFAIYLLTMVDNEVEMYNLMLEIVENIEKEHE